MSNHASVTTQSLPSFAQAFSSSGLGSYGQERDNALPPIQNRPARELNHATSNRSRPGSEEIPGALAGKKRARQDIVNDESNPSSSPRDSPRQVRIKEEHDHSLPEPSPPPLPPSPNKRRRAATLSSAPAHGSGSLTHLDMRLPSTDPLAASTPISPVVRGFTVRDDPAAIEQVRVAASISHQQKALIEQRRGSVAGILSPRAGDGEDRVSGHPKPPPSSRSRRSPTMLAASVSSIRRAAAGSPRVPSPSPLIVPSQNANQIIHSLPPPPISFARNRARQLGARKKAPPSELLISPREAMPAETFAPGIQSAPPGQAAFFARQQPSSGLLPMALPRLPALPPTTAAAADLGRRGIVPPTPTRLAAQLGRAPAPPTSNLTAPSNRSPPAASVPISASAQSLVPPTPTLALAAFQQQQHLRLAQQQRAPATSTASTFAQAAAQPAQGSGPSASHAVLADKAAFLAPFEVFFDALTDARTLKNWLAEQLQRSQGLSRQQETMLKAQDDAAKRVDSIAKQYEDTARRQEETLRRMESQLAYQESLLRQQDELAERRVRDAVRPLQLRIDILEGRSPHASPPLPGPGPGSSSSAGMLAPPARNGIPASDSSSGYTFPARHSPEIDARRTSSARLEAGAGPASASSSPALSHKQHHALRPPMAARARSQGRVSRGVEKERGGGGGGVSGEQEHGGDSRPAIRRATSSLGSGARLIKGAPGAGEAVEADSDGGGRQGGAGKFGKQDLKEVEGETAMDES
ncbi:hypothetical protein HGRIS_005664 [Hohenbuehelia grisea]|uniref:Proteophosphoglycan ppg4 n=1 Tax=Hohenbuehelia grisea TaxID=104357 RepID=A0ABR3JXI0_9AGAR